MVLALLMSQAYSAPVVTEINTGVSFSHELSGDTFTGIITWDDASSEGKYVALTIGSEVFTTDTKDIIVCASYKPAGAEVLKVVDATFTGSLIVKDADAKQSIGASPKALRATNVITCTFSRKLDTGDTDDFVIVAGVPFKMIVGTGDTNGATDIFKTVTKKGSAKDITIGTKAAVTPDPDDKKTDTTAKTESIGNLHIVGKLTAVVPAGVFLN